ncbi:MAG: amino acid adenylation domain-containing protein [Planctomycetes bacterium]|nr:amino acid adenylation domain-containing protein [Planctomycetota bacterium]
MTEHAPSSGRIAIVGRAGRFPGARDVAQFWRMLAEGRVATTWLSDEQLLAAGVSRQKLSDPRYVKAANVLPDMECFDAGYFGFSPREASILDPQHRHFLECAVEALEDAGHVPDRFDGRIGVFAGVGMQAYWSFNLLTNPELVDDVGLFLLRHTGNDKDFLPTRLSYLLDLKGPAVSVQTACSTGLVTVHLAMQSLLSGECDMAIAGGVTIEVPHHRGYRYAEGEILSPDGLCRAFDDDSQGTVFGSGVGLVVLRRLEDALADGDDIKAVLLGSAINNDGASKVGYLAPSIDGQAAAAAEALVMSGVEPDSVDYIEAHGTGTPIGDPIELAGLSQAYAGARKQSCGIGSVKTNIGHLDTAAGTASLIKVVEALRHQQLPPSLHYRTQNRRFDLPQSPFFVVDRLREWPRGERPRRAGINSLGVGGTNAHALVEEAPPRAPSPTVTGVHLLPLSARTAQSLDGLLDKWRGFVQQPDESLPALLDAAFTLQQGRRTFGERAVVAARDEAELRAALRGEAPWAVHRGSAPGDERERPEVVFLFPGGGAQYPGAGAGLLRESAVFRDAVDRCFAVLRDVAPADLYEVMFERTLDDRDARDKLNRSTWAIPALFVLEYAYACWWRALGVEPALVVAHSVGEYAAAVVAGTMQLDCALRITALRGRVMDEAPGGAMTTVPADEATVRALLAADPALAELDIAALNAPELTVVSGTREAIAALEARLAGSEHECRRIHIDVAAHSRVLEPVLDRFRRGFDDVRFGSARVPMISSLRGGPAEAGDLASADYWVRHLRHTVRFTQAMAAALERPGRVVVEVGPGQTLSPLVALANGPHRARAVLASARKPKDPADDALVASAAFGALWTHGVDVDWSKARHDGGRRVSLPTYAFEKQRHWIEPGRGAGAPEADAAAPPLRRRAALADWSEAFTWRELPLPPAGDEPRRALLLAPTTADGLVPIADALRRRLAARGIACDVVVPGQALRHDGERHVVRPDSIEDLEAVLQQLPAPDVVFDLWPLAAHDDRRLAFDGGFCLLRALLVRDLEQVRLVVATCGAAAPDGGQVADPTGAVMAGVVGCGPREVPGLSAVQVDLAATATPRDAAATLLLEATSSDRSHDLLAWRGDRRFAPQRTAAKDAAAATAPATTPLRQGGVYVLTGGTGGIGKALARWLAAHHGARVALLARHAAPDEAFAAEARAAGGAVSWHACDVADRGALAAALQQVRETHGAIHGVFHAAGALDDAPFAAKTLAQAHAVLAAKLDGARWLDELLPDGSLDTFCVFSSSSVVLRPAGQVDYVAANAGAAAIAAARRDGRSIAWGVWRDVGMAERAYGVGDTAPGPHTLLGPAVTHADGSVTFTRRFDPRELWLLDEHRVGGHPVLPGTAYVELAAAAGRAWFGDGPFELHELSLLQPMVFGDDAPRLCTVRISAHGDEHLLLVESRPGQGAEATEHARATLRAVDAPDRELPATLAAAGAPQLTTSPRSHQAPDVERITFGPRWHNVGELHADQHLATGEYQLPKRYLGDLQQFAVHPALLDMAATVGLEILRLHGDTSERRALFAPVGVRRVRLFAPLTERCRSRAVLVTHTPGKLCTFDVELRATDGAVLAVLEGLTMRAVPADGMREPGADDGARLTDVLLARGIRLADADGLFAHVLGLPARALVVSPMALDDVLLQMAAAQAASRPQRSHAASDRAGEPPRNEAERQVATLWGDLLGVADVGRDDDFFALGGHSLNAVRMLNRLKKQLGVDVPLTALFEKPTVEALAARVLEARPELTAPIAAPAAGAVAAATPAPLPAAEAPRAARTVPTTEAQREVFAAILIDAEQSRAYNLSFSWHFRGAFDLGAADAACRDLVRRHDSLRATFAADGQTLTIHADSAFHLERVDLCALAPEERDRRREALHRDAGERTFDLLQGPVLRAVAIRLDEERTELLFVVHHIACDGWSVGVAMRDWHALFEARRAGSAPTLPPAQSIAELERRERAFAATPDAERHRRYWLERFADGGPAMELPPDRQRPPVRTTRAARLDDDLGPALTERVRKAAQAIGASLPNFVFAAFHLWLGRMTQSKDVTVGLPTSGQLAHELDLTVGHCINFLPIRTRIDKEATFASFVHDVRRSLGEALDHQHFTYGALVRELRLHRDPSRTALVPVIFNIDNLGDLDTLPFAGLEARFAMNPRNHEHFELFVNLLEQPDRALLFWSYNRDLFRQETVRRHLQRFRRLLHGLANDPQRRLDAVGELLSGAPTPASGSHDDPGARGSQSIVGRFRRIAEQHAARTAVRFGDATMDYATLDRRSDALAAWLQEQGVVAGGLVGITSQRALELVVAVLAVLKTGCGYVPFDKTLPDERLAFMAGDTGVEVLLGECPALEAGGVRALPFAAFPRGDARPLDVEISGEHVAYVMYTSGTTGRPKGVVLPHRSVIRMLVDTDWLQLGPDTVTLHSSAFAFDTSIIDLFAALLHGGTVVIPPDGALSIQQLADAIQSHGVNTLWLTSGLFHAVADLRPEVFVAVRQVIVGGDVVSPVQVRKVMDTCPEVLVINGYGPTESNVTNAHPISRDDLATGQALPIGRAIPGTQCYVVDDELRPVEAGVQGELVISGRGLALGYHNRPELTAERFVTAPWDQKLRLYRTGDIAMDPGDGVIRFFGRADGQVKVRGFRVELGEVEAALEGHPAIRQAVVVAVVPPGQSDKVLAAYLVPEGSAPAANELRAWLAERLPDFARPHHFAFVEQLPLNHNGKVDRKALPPIMLTDTGAAPLAGELEHRIAAIWQRLLGVKDIGAETEFFALGGHSLLAVRLFDAIQDEFGATLPISTLFQHPTIRSLAQRIERARGSAEAQVRIDDPWDTSVVIARGPDQGGARPLFLVGGVGGNVNNLYELGRAVGATRPVIGFQTRGILGHRPLDSIEAMAADHVRWLRQHQPNGPYLIAGYSGGAITAFEMARQLRAAGEQVAQLFVFDTYAPGFAVDFRPQVRLTMLQRLRSEVGLLREEGVAFFFERLRAKLQNTVMRRPTQWFLRTFRPSRFKLSKVEDVWRAAAARYRGGHFDGHVTLLQTEPRALMSRLAHQQDPTLGWERFVSSDRLHARRVPGDHLRMVQGQNAVELARVIEQALDESAARRPGVDAETGAAGRQRFVGLD